MLICNTGTEKSTRGSRHTTGIYGANAAGEVMPPLYCFDSSCANEENYQVRPEWVEGLPTVKGRYGCPTTESYDSFVSVRKSGCTDEQLMQQLIEEVYLPLYPNCNKSVLRDEEGRFMSGPIILKTDSGQGRLCATFSNVEFCERMQERGVYLVLGLPNSTSCTQELDQIYQEFKGKTRTKTEEVFALKLAKRSNLIAELKVQLKGEGFIEDCAADTNMEVTPAMAVIIEKIKDAKKTPSLTNMDLSDFVNGEDRNGSPFYSTFTKAKIMNCFARVGYVPFTRECLKSEYIRHELQENGKFFLFLNVILYYL